MGNVYDNAISPSTRQPIKTLVKCGVCRCVISDFSGEHVVKKNTTLKTVCGLCAAQLEVKGWVVIARAK